MKTIITNYDELARLVGGIITDIDPLEDGANDQDYETIITDILEVEDGKRKAEGNKV